MTIHLNCDIKLVQNGEGWILKVICESHDHELSDILICHSNVNIIKNNENSMVFNMTKSLVS